MTSDAVVDCKHLAKSFDRPVLSDVSISVAAGEVVSVMGRSGSGKSTLLHCIAGIQTVDSGTIRVDGIDVTELSSNARLAFRRNKIGFVFQFGQLVEELTALENVGLPLMLDGIRRREALAVAESWLERLGMSDRKDSFPRQLSGGEAQRVAVARAFVTQPKVVLADEPTGSLDSHNGEVVFQMLTEAASRDGAALLIATHDEGIASRTSRIVELVDGSLGAVRGGADKCV